MSFHNTNAVCGICVFACALAASAAENNSVPQQRPINRTAPLSDAAPSTVQVPEGIKDEIGEAVCDADAQCHSIGIGVKACGGPEAYVAWSSKSSDYARLTALIAKHSDDRRLKNERSGMVSDCRAIPDPGAVCRPRAPDGKRVCQLGQGGQRRLD